MRSSANLLAKTDPDAPPPTTITSYFMGPPESRFTDYADTSTEVIRFASHVNVGKSLRHVHG